MRSWQSVRFRIVFGFFLIVAPLVLFLIYNNLYAARIVREQVSTNYGNLLDVEVNANDTMLKSTFDFLIQLGTANDSEILSLKTLPVTEPDYTLAKVRLSNRFALDTSYYKMVDTFYVYLTKESSYPLFATQNNAKSSELSTLLTSYSAQFFKEGAPLSDKWEAVRLPGYGAHLIKAIDIDFGMLDGALVRIDTLNQTISKLDVGPQGAVFVMDGQGNLLSSKGLPDNLDGGFQSAILHMKDREGTIKWKNKKYLVLTRNSQYADIRYVIVTTEPYILKNLPFLQKMLYYWIPLLSIAVVTGYILYLRRYLFRPLARLVVGMRRLGHGRLDVRLPAPSSASEFSIMTKTFNQMARQIEELKIDVYEEQLRVQKAEYKHLQMQINPHFYTNTLNIIYNMAALKDFKSVQKMTLHLANYFRFLMHGNRTTVTLEEELGHIGHYMEIQKLRYVDMLVFEIEVPPEHMALEIPPLLLQPFAENAILHGLTRRQQDGMPFRIWIKSENEEGDPARIVRITITDNGPGFPPHMLKELESGTYTNGSGERHLGIWNVLRRFRILYGDEGGITFRNGDHGGAVVEVRLPVQRPSAFRDNESPAKPPSRDEMEEIDVV
ncbi:hypothetical protein PSTEL_26370 [Paenibacillus stellifer]|uniref:HAMP domain-containing protein n=1 Tax=Paenibacillus stellifer TaxID=169760 RepID=A0A089M3M9_9BACL|nr:histidine kinase [Paenibacillus stellifer]AIQ66113.1 hypothetical protein PSTEL_26370 [Paenibacillus stellifer]